MPGWKKAELADFQLELFSKLMLLNKATTLDPGLRRDPVSFVMHPLTLTVKNTKPLTT
jgi:hypothetical protein